MRFPQLSPPTPLLPVLSSHFLGIRYLATLLSKKFNEIDTPGFLLTTMSYSSLSMGFFIFWKVFENFNKFPKTNSSFPAVEINGRSYLGEGDVSVGIGEMQHMIVDLVCVASTPQPFNNNASTFRGDFSLRCFQDLQNGSPLVDRMENLVVCGLQRRPFHVKLDSEKVGD
jgi:hypothetical protein